MYTSSNLQYANILKILPTASPGEKPMLPSPYTISLDFKNDNCKPAHTIFMVDKSKKARS